MRSSFEITRNVRNGQARQLLWVGALALAIAWVPVQSASAEEQETLGEADARVELAETESLEKGAKALGESEENLEVLDAPPGTMGAEGVTPGGKVEPATAGAIHPDAEVLAEIAPNECMQGVYGDPPNSGCGNPEGRPWHYDTRYFFGLTRGLTGEAGVSKKGWPWIAPMTFPIDVTLLPFAALSGLSGT